MKTTIESLVRQIVREELAKWQENLTSSPSSPSPRTSPPSSLSSSRLGLDGDSSPRELESVTIQISTDSPIPDELIGLPLYEADIALRKRWSELKAAWILAFPAVDLAAEIKKAHAWEQSNPRRKKTDRAKYLFNWLSKAQQNASRGASCVQKEDYSWMDEQRPAPAWRQGNVDP